MVHCRRRLRLVYVPCNIEETLADGAVLVKADTEVIAASKARMVQKVVVIMVQFGMASIELN